MKAMPDPAHAKEEPCLHALLRAALGRWEPADWPELFEGVDTDVLTGHIREHRVGAFLHHRLPTAVKSALPLPLASQLQAAAAANARRVLVQEVELIRAAKTLRIAGVPILSLKGPLLARQLYGAPNLRYAGDIDLLVTWEDAERADRALREAGYRRRYPSTELTPQQLRKYLHLYHEFSYGAPTTGLNIEIKWSAESIGDAKEAWRQCVAEPLGHELIPTLAPETNVHYIFEHGAKHAWCRLYWLLDAALYLERDDWDRSRLLALARQTHALRAVSQGALLCHTLFGTRIPGEFVAPPEEERVLDCMVAESRRRMRLNLVRTLSVGENLRRIRYKLQLHETWKAKGTYLMRFFISYENWMTLSLPDWLFFLHYPAEPFFWLRRRVTRWLRRNGPGP